jgi:Family of unknown function (DUF6247)
VTSLHPAHHAVMDRPACTPAAIRAVLAAQADESTLRRYDRDLDSAFDQARRDGDLTPLLETVRRWWFEADAWRDPDGQQRFQERMSRYLKDGPPPPAERLSREEIRERYGV